MENRLITFTSSAHWNFIISFGDGLGRICDPYVRVNSSDIDHMLFEFNSIGLTNLELIEK